MREPYWSSFGYEWQHFPRVQLDVGDRHESEETFRQKTGLGPEDVKGKRVLDVGCGAGRFLEVVSRWGAQCSHGVEPSDASAVGRENLLGRPGVSVYDTDLDEYKYSLGVWGTYDIVYCIGVLHHTPDPAASFRTISHYVKPGGLLCVWVYQQMGAWDRMAQLYRKITTRMPWSLLHLFSYIAVPWDYVRRIPKIGNYIWCLIPCSTHPDWRWRVLDTFDWYSPKYQSKHTKAEVMAWFLDAGFIEVEALNFPVAVRGRRPA